MVGGYRRVVREYFFRIMALHFGWQERAFRIELKRAE